MGFENSLLTEKKKVENLQRGGGKVRVSFLPFLHSEKKKVLLFTVILGEKILMEN